MKYQEQEWIYSNNALELLHGWCSLYSLFFNQIHRSGKKAEAMQCKFDFSHYGLIN